MKRESGWIEKFGATVAILLLLGGSLWVWDGNDYPLPSILEPSYDPFAHPTEATSLQRVVENLRGARFERKNRNFERRRAREREAEMIQGFREFKLAGNRFWFSYFPADEIAGADGEFSLSESSLIRSLETDEGGGHHPLSVGLRLIRLNDKTLVLESPTNQEEWTLDGYRGPWTPTALPPIPSSERESASSGFSFPITPPDFGPELEFEDERGNELRLTEWSEVPEVTTDPPIATEAP